MEARQLYAAEFFATPPSRNHPLLGCHISSDALPKILRQFGHLHICTEDDSQKLASGSAEVSRWALRAHPSKLDHDLRRYRM
jgi:hypothetical protein